MAKKSIKREGASPNLADVAREAGVAVSTVSRVVNGSSLVSPELREQVEEVIKRIGYKPVPKEKRKGIRKNPRPWLKHRFVKVVIHGPYDAFWITNYAPVYSYALHGIEEQLGQYDLRRSIERSESPAQLLDLMQQGGADGFLILNTSKERLPDAIAKHPVVTFMGLHADLSCDRVVPDSAQAGVLAAEYLHAQGCRVCVALGEDRPLYHERTDAFRGRLESHGVETKSMLNSAMVRGGERMHQVNRAAVAESLSPLLANAARPLGIFSLADIVTPALYAELEKSGMRVGRDVHVVSCNNERPYLDQLVPLPAVIDTRAGYIGRRSVDQLMRRLEFPRAPYEQIRVQPTLLAPEIH